MKKTISIMTEEFENEKTGERVEGITIMVDGAIKELFDIIVDAQPTVEMQKNKCGKWAHIGGDEWSCSCCGFIKHTEGSCENPDAKYCENCGMRRIK